MPMTCCAYGCFLRFDKNKDIHFHGFPLTKKDLLSKWINVIKRRDFKLSKYSKVCSDHFRSTDFLIQPGFKYKRLKDDAVVSIFEEFPEHLEKKSTVSRTTKTSLAAETKGYTQFEESVMESENHRDVHIQTDLTSVEVTERMHNLQCNVDA